MTPYADTLGGFEMANPLGHVPTVQHPIVRERLRLYRVPSRGDHDLKAIKDSLIDSEGLPVPRQPINFAVATDSSPLEPEVDPSFPSTRLVFMQMAAVIVNLEKFRRRDGQFADPSRLRDAQRASVMAAMLPGSNLPRIDGTSPEQAFREEVEHLFRSSRTNQRTLLEVLAHVQRHHEDATDETVIINNCPACRADTRHVPIPPSGAQCPNSRCHGPLFYTDVLRAHEAFNEQGSNLEASGRVMAVAERLISMALMLRVLQRRPSALGSMAFVTDGPLGLFGPPAKLKRPLLRLLQSVAVKLAGNGLAPPITVGIEKCGAFHDHGVSIADHIPEGHLMLPDDDYIKHWIAPGNGAHGEDTYYGKHFYYRSAVGGIFTLSIPPLRAVGEEPHTVNDSKRISDAAGDLRASGPHRHPPLPQRHYPGRARPSVRSLPPGHSRPRAQTARRRPSRNQRRCGGMTVERGEPPRPEIIVGLVGPVGVDLRMVSDLVRNQLRQYNYRVEPEISLSGLLDHIRRDTPLPAGPRETYVRTRMDEGNRIRQALGANDALVELACAEVMRRRNELRTADVEHGAPTVATAWILRSLKHQDEASTLRQIYGERFVCIGAQAPRRERLEQLARDIAASHGSTDREEYKAKAQELALRDEAEDVEHGQKVRKTFVTADCFIDASHRQSAQQQLARFFDAWFGEPYASPSRDEFAMFQAKAAAARSADLSRQVGASIVINGAIVAVGCNEVPAFGGGAYWEADHKDARDFMRGVDANAQTRGIAVEEVRTKLKDAGWLATLHAHDSPDNFAKVLAGTRLDELTEFGRAVHAEMSAILDAARRGVALEGAWLYCTTFPCHNCAKHLVGAGFKRVFFIEPYPKSLAEELHPDSVIIDPSSEEEETPTIPAVCGRFSKHLPAAVRAQRQTQTRGRQSAGFRSPNRATETR